MPVIADSSNKYNVAMTQFRIGAVMKIFSLSIQQSGWQNKSFRLFGSKSEHSRKLFTLLDVGSLSLMGGELSYSLLWATLPKEKSTIFCYGPPSLERNNLLYLRGHPLNRNNAIFSYGLRPPRKNPVFFDGAPSDEDANYIHIICSSYCGTPPTHPCRCGFPARPFLWSGVGLALITD